MPQASEQTVVLDGLAATARFGQWLGANAAPGDIITLTGGLGAGKTTLTQGIGQGLGIPPSCYITSPTFSLLHEYLGGRLPLYHLDLYRISPEEIIELGFEDFLYGCGLSVVEWSQRLEGLTPPNRLHIDLQLISETRRSADLTWQGTMRARRLPLPPSLTTPPP